MKASIIAMAVAVLAVAACGNRDKDYDATGTFEATEVTVSAEQNGKLLRFDVSEGSILRAGQQAGLIDTVQLYLKALQIGASKEVYARQRPDVQKQAAALRQQLAKAEQEQARFAALVKDGATNRKQLDDANSQVQVIRRQLEAQLSSLDNSTQSLNAQMSTADIQRHQVADQLAKCRVVAPITGTVLEKYTEAGEYAVVGKPLFKMADTEHMFIRAYITSAQLKNVKMGQKVKVFANYGNGERRQYGGTVAWISERSEFTPKTILTADERADLVYAVKIAVKNDGYIKIGMYGEVKL